MNSNVRARLLLCLSVLLFLLFSKQASAYEKSSVVQFDAAYRNMLRADPNATYTKCLQALISGHDVSEIHFTAGKTYKLRTIVFQNTSHKTLVGNGARLKRTLEQRRMFQFEGSPARVSNVIITGFVFDFVRWKSDFDSIIQFRTGQFKDISIHNNLFVATENDVIGNGSSAGADSWVINLAPKKLNDDILLKSSMENIFIEDNVCIAKEIGFTSGGSDGGYKNCRINRNTVIRSEIAIDMIVNRSQNAESFYHNVEIAGNTIINPAETGIHMGLDSDNLAKIGKTVQNFGKSNRHLEIKNLKITSNQILYGKRKSQKAVNAIIFRPGVTGSKVDILIKDNEWRFDASIDDRSYKFQHIGSKILRQGPDETTSFVDEFTVYGSGTATSETGPHSEFRVDLSINQFPKVDAIAVPPVNFEIENNIGSPTSRIKLRGLNEGTTTCSEINFTTIHNKGNSDLPVERLSQFSPHIYQLTAKRKYPVLSEAISIDPDTGFSLAFNIYGNNFCDDDKILFWQDDDNFIGVEPTNSSLPKTERGSSLIVKLDGQKHRLTAQESSGPLAEHQCYHVTIKGNLGYVTIEVFDFFSKKLLSSFTTDKFLKPISIKTIGGSLSQLAKASNQSQRCFDGYIWSVNVSVGMNDFATTLRGFSAERDESSCWENSLNDSKGAILMALNTFQFNTHKHVQLPTTIETSYDKLNLRFKLFANQIDNRVLFFKDSEHFCRLEKTGRIKIKAGVENSWVSLTRANAIRPGHANDIRIKGSREDDSHVCLTTYINGHLHKQTIFATEPEDHSFTFSRIGGREVNTDHNAKPFDGVIWDITLRHYSCTAAGNTDLESWKDSSGASDGTVINYFQN